MKRSEFLLLNLGEGASSHGSGGTERASRVFNEIQSLGNECLVLGTCGLKKFLDKRNIALDVIEVKFPKGLHDEKSSFTRLAAYVFCTISGLREIRKIETKIVVSASDYFPDVLLAFYIKVIRKDLVWISVIHHKGRLFQGSTRKNISAISKRCLQLFSWFIIRHKSNLLLTYKTNEGYEIVNSMLFRKIQHKYIENGFDIELINSAPAHTRPPDILLSGGPRVSKGIFDLPLVIKGVKRIFPQVSIGIAGEGTPATISALIKKLEEHDVGQHVYFYGNLEKLELYSLIKGSKVVVSLSHEEGWGIAIREALACERPCVVYELPAFHDLRNHIQFAPLGDVAAMVQKIVKVLNGLEVRASGPEKPTFKSWKEVALDDLFFMREILNKI